MAQYPSHIYEPARRKIALSYVRHELRKLFPTLSGAKAWGDIDADAGRWYDGNPTLEPVRGFWNGFCAISSGFKLKNLVDHLTSKNMKWEEKDIPVNELWFGATFRQFEEAGELPSAKAVAQWLHAPGSGRLENIRRHLKSLSGQASQDIDSDPVIVTFVKSRYVIADGNRRTLKALASGQLTLPAAVGTAVAMPDIFDQWVPSELLLHLTHSHRYFLSLGRDTTAVMAGAIAELLKHSAPGRQEWLSHTLSPGDGYDIKLWRGVAGEFRKWGMDLGSIGG